ncbi:hypothetical protein HDU67_007680, partial [Dinochytrium kinnereticum]
MLNAPVKSISPAMGLQYVKEERRLDFVDSSSQQAPWHSEWLQSEATAKAFREALEDCGETIADALVYALASTLFITSHPPKSIRSAHVFSPVLGETAGALLEWILEKALATPVPDGGTLKNHDGRGMVGIVVEQFNKVLGMVYAGPAREDEFVDAVLRGRGWAERLELVGEAARKVQPWNADTTGDMTYGLGSALSETSGGGATCLTALAARLAEPGMDYLLNRKADQYLDHPFRAEAVVNESCLENRRLKKPEESVDTRHDVDGSLCQEVRMDGQKLDLTASFSHPPALTLTPVPQPIWYSNYQGQVVLDPSYQGGLGGTGREVSSSLHSSGGLESGLLISHSQYQDITSPHEISSRLPEVCKLPSLSTALNSLKRKNAAGAPGIEAKPSYAMASTSTYFVQVPPAYTRPSYTPAVASSAHFSPQVGSFLLADQLSTGRGNQQSVKLSGIGQTSNHGQLVSAPVYDYQWYRQANTHQQRWPLQDMSTQAKRCNSTYLSDTNLSATSQYYHHQRGRYQPITRGRGAEICTCKPFKKSDLNPFAGQHVQKATPLGGTQLDTPLTGRLRVAKYENGYSCGSGGVESGMQPPPLRLNLLTDGFLRFSENSQILQVPGGVESKDLDGCAMPLQVQGREAGLKVAE